MSAAPIMRRMVAEIEGQAVNFRIGSRTIHQFWHLFSAHFRALLITPQRRPDSGNVAWSWREASESRPVTASELAEIRRRLTEANRLLALTFSQRDRDVDASGRGGATLERQVQEAVNEMIEELMAQREAALTRFICRTETGLMLHSWGASDAAEPQSLDAQNEAISGTVFAGEERLVGANVVLELAKGSSVAQTKTGSDGSFHFPNVPPGTYRVRVTERTDFSPTGLAVTMDHEAITSLTLRRSTDSAEISPAAKEKPRPWYQRREFYVPGLLLLLLLIGSCVWRAARPAPKPVAAIKTSVGWQTATGKLAINDVNNTSRETRKISDEGTWTPPPETTTKPKITTPLTQTPDKTSSALSPTLSRSPETARSSSSAAETEPTSTDPTVKTKLPGAPQEQPKPTDKSAAPAVKPTNSTKPADKGSPPSETTPDSAPDESDQSSAAENTAPPFSTSTAKNKNSPTTVPNAPSASPEESSATAAPGAGADESPNAAAALVTSGKKSNQPAKVKNSATPYATPAAPAVIAPGAEAGAPANPMAAAAPTTDQTKASPTKKPKAQTAPAAASAAPAPSAAPTDTNQSAVVADASSDTSASPEPTAPTTPEKSAAAAAARAKKSPTGSKPPKTTPTEKPAADNPPDDAAAPSAVSAQPEKKAPKPEVPTKNKPKSTAKPAADATASPETSDESTPDASPEQSAPEKPTPPSDRSKPSSNKPANTDSPEPATDENQPVETPSALSPAELTPAAPITHLTVNPLKEIRRVRATVSKPRLLHDTIIPTRPVTAAEEDAMEALRAKLLQEQNVRMPQLFRQPQLSQGFSFEYTPNSDEKKMAARWHNDAGAETEGATVNGNRAELSWSGTATVRNGSFILSYPNGRELAHVTIDEAGVPLVKRATGIQAWYWMGIERPAVGTASPSSAQPTGALEWRMRSGEPVPATWPQDNHWREGRGQQIAIPLGLDDSMLGSYTIALADPLSDWAIVYQITLQ